MTAAPYRRREALTESDPLEMRADPRTGTDLPVEIHAQGFKGPLPARARDLSVGGMRIEATPGLGLRLFGGYRLDEREGTRATGGTHMFAFRNSAEGSVLDLSEPIDMRTHEVTVGLAWARFVRVESAPFVDGPSGSGTAAFDLEAVAAVNSVPATDENENGIPDAVE